MSASARTRGSLPTRATDNIRLAMSDLVSFALQRFTALDGYKPWGECHTYTPAGNRARQAWVDEETGELVDKDALIRQATVHLQDPATGEIEEVLVPFSDDEQGKLLAETVNTDGTARIIAYVPLSSLFDGTYYVDGFAQLRPAKVELKLGKGPKRKVYDPGASRAFAILLAAMARENVAAVFQLPTRSAARYVALLPDARLAVLAYDHQVRAALPMPEAEPSEAEVAFAVDLIHQVGIGTPELVDATGPAVAGYLLAKARGEVAEPATAAAPPEAASVSNLLELLKASVEAAGKAA